MTVVEPQTGRTVVSGQLAMELGLRKLYKVDVVDEMGETVTAVGARLRNKPTSLETWHCRCGHSDVWIIKRMADASLVDGLEITNCRLDGLCEDCIYGKIVQHPFDEVVVPKKKPYEHISVDLFGKTRTVSVGGAVYIMLCACGGTGLKFPYFLASKHVSVTLNVFKKFHKMAERQTGEKILHVWFDKGREFDNGSFIGYLKSKGILWERVPKASSSANGVVERGNWTVIEGVRTQLKESGLHHKWWAEAAGSHCYIPTAHHPDIVLWQR